MKERTIRSIIDNLRKISEDKTINLSPQDYMRESEYLVILVEDEYKKLALLEQQVAQMKVDLKRSGIEKAIDIKNEVESTDLYREMRIQESLLKQVYEMINIAKLQARLVDTTIRGN